MRIRPRPLATLAACAAVGLAALPAQPAGAVLVAPRTVQVLTSVDAGGLTASPGWTADNGFVGGKAGVGYRAVGTTPGEAPAAVASTSRWGEYFTYTVRSLEPGARYTVRLVFAEDYFTAAGQRTFSVDVNGTRALDRFDIVAAAGGPGRTTHRDVSAVADARGFITLAFEGADGSDALVQGFQVIGLGPKTRLGSTVAPTGLRVVPTGPASVHVSWDRVTGVGQYVVLRDGREIGRTAEYAYIDTTAVAGKRYSYTVAAVDPDKTRGLPARAIGVTVPGATPKATGAYHVEGARIIGPDGKPFVPMGINVGTKGILDGGGSALGHTPEAKAWGWNAVRLVVRPEGWDDADLQALVSEYRKAGMVVILDAHLTFNPWDPMAPTFKQNIADMWKVLAPRYANDSGVWFNIANEPGDMNDEWLDDNDPLAKQIRATGAKNIIIVDAPTWGQDLGSHYPWHAGARLAYSPTQAPLLAARYGNVVLGQHNYGAFEMYDTPAKYGAYLDAVHRSGIPVVSSEFGYTYNASWTAGSYFENQRGADAVFGAAPAKGVGILPWNGNGGDAYSLKNDGGPFWSGGAGANLSPMGVSFWALTH